MPHLCLCQETYESQCFRGPPASDFHGEHHQSGPAPRCRELWRSAFLSSPGFHQSDAVTLRSSTVRGSISTKRGHHCGVHCQLSPSDEGQAISNNLQSATVQGVRSSDVEVAQEDVGGHSASCFSTDASSGSFQCKTRAYPTLQPVRKLCGGAQGRQGDACRSDGRREGGRRRRLNKSTRKSWGSKLVSGVQGVVEKATRSVRDLMSARSPSDSAGINCNSLNCSYSREEASCCHPNIWAPGS